MSPPDVRRRKLGIAALLVPLFAILVAAFWFASRAWTVVSGPPMPGIGYLAMTLGVIFSLIIGCGLMALLFYSNRHGYDEPTRIDLDDHE
jgi:formate hydrogenlyase subunit 3/multisubunit Na+/H+ antiporter MnhD subunit